MSKLDILCATICYSKLLGLRVRGLSCTKIELMNFRRIPKVTTFVTVHFSTTWKTLLSGYRYLGYKNCNGL